MVKIPFHDPVYNRFRLIHPCDRQTDRRTDGWAIAYNALSMLYAVRAKNWKTKTVWVDVKFRMAKQ